MSEPTTPDPATLGTHLQRVTEALAAAHTVQDVAEIALGPALSALGALSGSVLLVSADGARLEVAAVHGQGGQTVWQEGPLERGLPAGDALLRREALYYEHAGSLTRDYPELEARTGGVAAVACAVLPMALQDQLLGVLVLDFREPHEFSPEERQFLETLAAQGALALGRAHLQQTLEARVSERTAELEAERAALGALVAYQEAVGAETDVLALARRAAGMLRAHLGHVSVAYYELQGGRWTAQAWSDDLPPGVVAQITAGVPAQAPSFAEAARTGAARFIDGWSAEGEGLASAASYGAVALLPLGAGGACQHLFTAGIQEARAWTGREQAMVRAVARGLQLTLERSEHLRALEDERAALAAFARLTEDVTHVSDPHVFARMAGTVLHELLGVDVGYSEVSGGRWVGVVFSEGTPPGVIAAARAGFAADLPTFARPFAEGGAVFAECWDAHAEGASAAAIYRAAALYPYLRGGEPASLLTMGHSRADHWTERERSVFRAVGRGLALALERAEVAGQLAAQNAELSRRTRALETFVGLMGELSPTLGEPALIRRAQEVALSHLPEGFSTYYEPAGDLWHLRAQVGEMPGPALQAAVSAGLPRGKTPSLDRPWTEGAPLFQAQYRGETDGLTEAAQEVAAGATLPVSVGGEQVGVLAVGLYIQRAWGPADRAVLETVAGSLGLALTGARTVAQLAEERRRLEAANEELVAFTYSVSHDLRTPVRHVTSFARLLSRALGDGLDAKPKRYLRVVEDAAERMNLLIDGMLQVSRTSRLRLRRVPVDLAQALEAVRRELRPAEQGREIQWKVAPLPVVPGDPEALRQVLQILLDNALKFTRPREVARIEVWAEECAGEWRVSVRDNGVGFDARYAERLFGIFQRLHRAEDFEGAGVGLANLRRIITRHGGEVHAHSAPGEGATFTFTLPRGGDGPPPTGDPSPHAEGPA